MQIWFLSFKGIILNHIFKNISSFSLLAFFFFRDTSYTYVGVFYLTSKIFTFLLTL